MQAWTFSTFRAKETKLSQPQQLMAQERKILDEAYAGDINRVFDPGIFSIGDTISVPGKIFAYEEFRPLHRSILPKCVRSIR